MHNPESGHILPAGFICPNCSCSLPKTAVECSACKAVFTDDAAWQPVPVNDKGELLAPRLPPKPVSRIPPKNSAPPPELTLPNLVAKLRPNFKEAVGWGLTAFTVTYLAEKRLSVALLLGLLAGARALFADAVYVWPWRMTFFLATAGGTLAAVIYPLGNELSIKSAFIFGAAVFLLPLERGRKWWPQAGRSIARSWRHLRR